VFSRQKLNAYNCGHPDSKHGKRIAGRARCNWQACVAGKVRALQTFNYRGCQPEIGGLSRRAGVDTAWTERQVGGPPEAGHCSNAQNRGGVEDSQSGTVGRRRQERTSLHNVAFLPVGSFACILAAVSVYGLAQRRREMGIRMALGAQRKTVLLLMMRGEMRAVLLGGIFSLPLMLGFVVLCSLGLAPRIVPEPGLWRRCLPNC